MDLLNRITAEINKIKKRGDIPTIIWLGRSEKYELEKLSEKMCVKPNREKIERQILGLPYHFISSENWLTVSYEEEK